MSNLPPGYRFFPTEEELVGFYLRCKLDRKRDDLDRVIPVLDIYSLDPCQLPSFSGELCIGDEEQWFFFSPRQEREAHGGRPNRITPSGYWKATGIPGYVFSSENKIIGLKRTMVFYEGKAPKGKKTKWKVNEYKAIEEATTSANSSPKVRHEINLCRVYITSGNLRSFDRRPPVTRTGMMLDGEEYGRAILPAINFCSNEGANDRNRSESSHANPTMEEQACSYLHSSPREGTSNALTIINDLEFLWDSLIQDRL